jgi:MoaA/NifB/PqqE/SkfB family radical SAM enzyme
MCNIWNIRDDKNIECTMAEKQRFVESLRGLVGPEFEFHLSGGEPLMTEGILDLIRFISDEGYRTNLVTNGFLIEKSLARDIVNSGLNSLTFSLDGIMPETHDFIRGVKGSYERIMKAIEYLDAFRNNGLPKISLLTIIMGHNLDEILRLTEWAERDKKIEMISFQAITQPLCEDRDDLWFTREKNSLLWPKDTQKISAIMERLRELRLNGCKIGNHPNHFLHFREYFRDPDKFLKKIKCNLGDYEFHVDPYGKAFFCTLTEPFGNIKTDNLPEIWVSPRARSIREKVYSCKKNCHIMINCFYEDEFYESAAKNARTA